MESLMTNKICPNCSGILMATDDKLIPFVCRECGKTYSSVDEKKMELCIIVPKFVSLRRVAKLKMEENLFDIQVDDNRIAVISKINMDTCELIKNLQYSYIDLKC